MLTQDKEKYQEVLQVAERLSRQSPDWVTFFREVIGIDGIVRKSFPSQEELNEFEQSDEFERIQQMVVKLREKRTSADADNEPTRVITVRLPKSMHEYLRTEAHDLRTSMNKLCISKLLQVIGEDKIPNERSSGGSTSTAPAVASPASNGSTENRTAATPPQSYGDFTKPVPPQQPTSPFKPTQHRF